MKWRMLAVFGTVSASLACTAAASLPLSSETAKLQVWVGHWKTTGVSNGAPWHADTSCSWSANHGFVICDQLIKDEINQLMILSYDPAGKNYRISSIGKDREPFISHGRVAGAIWTNTAELDENGKKILLKTIVDFSRPDHYSDRETVSEDGGVHWTETSRGQSTKLR